MDLFDKCRQYTKAREAMAAGLYPYFHALETAQDTEVMIGGKRIIMIGSNNYMGLTPIPDHRGRQGCAGPVWNRAVRAPRFPQRHAGAARAAGEGTGRFLPQGGGADIQHRIPDQRCASFRAWRDFTIISLTTRRTTPASAMPAVEFRQENAQVRAQRHGRSGAGAVGAAPRERQAHHHRRRVQLDGRHRPAAPDRGTGPQIQRPRHGGRRSRYGDDRRGRTGARPLISGWRASVDIIMTTFSKSLPPWAVASPRTNRSFHFIRHNSRPFIFSASLPRPAPPLRWRRCGSFRRAVARAGPAGHQQLHAGAAPPGRHSHGRWNHSHRTHPHLRTRAHFRHHQNAAGIRRIR